VAGFPWNGVPARDSLEDVSLRGPGELDDPTSRGRDPLVTDLVVRIKANGDPVKLDYMMRRNGECWLISDIYLAMGRSARWRPAAPSSPPS
jgi:hypothetical protein